MPNIAEHSLQRERQTQVESISLKFMAQSVSERSISRSGLLQADEKVSTIIIIRLIMLNLLLYFVNIIDFVALSYNMLL